MHDQISNLSWHLWVAGVGLAVLGACLGWLLRSLIPLRRPGVGLPTPAPAVRAAETAPPQAEPLTPARRELLTVVNHEIRTPLNGVIGYTDLLLETALLADQREFAMNVRQSAEVLVALLNDISDYARLQDGQLELRTTAFDFTPTLLAAMELFAQRAGEKGLELAHNLGPNPRLPVRADATRTRQVLLNLLSNAVNFTSEGQIVVRVEILPGFLKCTVSDTGCGIAPEIQARLFRRSGPADDFAARRMGTEGVGLTLSKGLVELMGGQLGFASQPGQGSDFWFHLPLASEGASGGSTGAETLLPAADSARVLLVEPAHASREMILNHLAAARFAVQATDTAQDALRLLYQASLALRPFQSVIFAEKLPDQAGRSFARTLRADAELRLTGLVCLRRPGGRPTGPGSLGGLGVMEVAKPVLSAATLVNAVRVAPTMRPTTDSTQTALGLDEEPVRAGTQVKPVQGHALLVEDNELNQRVLIEMLRRDGWSCQVADNGAEGVRLACLNKYDLILMDCHLPEVDGFTATRQIRQNEMATRTPRTPVVAVTAEVLNDSRERCLAAGMDDCLTKPIRRTELEETLKRWARKPAVG
ncbi:MAG TPA: response regulator [Candidatus Limnocylindria bacterium]|jgi:signal transduction histidine kinase/CheY-like chemotaxis protein|nr:response regulator [Candidatus Limnocylindria bacterium]